VSASPLRFSLDVARPFFEERHVALAAELGPAVAARASALTESADSAVSALGAQGLDLFRHLLPSASEGASGHVDVRTLVLVREALAQRSPMADSIFAVQGLGSFPVLTAGRPELRERIRPEVARGTAVGAFALTEPEAGSDVASLKTQATRRGDGWVLSGEKTLISNVGIATHYVVFATVDPGLGRKGITAFFVPKSTAGLSEAALYPSSPHPLGALALEDAFVPDEYRLGEVGGGFLLAMGTLDTFRISVGAAANGMAQRALDLALRHVTSRKQFGAPLAEREQIQAMLAEMATELVEAQLMVARAAHARDAGGGATLEAAMAKMSATEKAQRIIDRAVQLHGGRGVLLGSEVEALYRDVRPLRIYEGTTEIQKIVIARALLKTLAATERG
jgi:acyl-CoA dehydrogenase